MTSPSRPILDYPCSYPIAKTRSTTGAVLADNTTPTPKRTPALPTLRPQTTEGSRMRCALPRRRKWRRVGHDAHPRHGTKRAPPTSNRWMPSRAFRPRARAAPPPVVGLIHNRGLAAAVCLNIAITVTTTIKRAAQTQNNVILSPQTTEERKTMRRALLCRLKHERA